MIRITADIDNHQIRMILRNISIAIVTFKLDVISITIDKSNSKGYHVSVFVSNRMNDARVYAIREFIGDDKRRITMDKKRKHPKQYLFKEKTYLNGKKDKL